MAKSIVLLIVIMVILMWFILRPGLYVVSPMPGMTDGITLVYYDRHSNVPFFYSTDLQCLLGTDSNTTTCRETAYRNAIGLRERTLLRIPFSEWVRLRSLEKYPSKP